MKYLNYITLLIGLFFVSSLFAKENEKPDLFISFEINSDNIYEHEVFPISVILYSSTGDVSYVNGDSEIYLKKGSFDYIKKIKISDSPKRVEIKGSVFYRIPIEEYLVSFSNKGTYTIQQNKMEVGISYPVVIRDPFWGYMRTSETKSFDIQPQDLNIKVKSLPSAPSNIDFSGAIGEFSVETLIPKGDIFVNEDAIALIKIKGNGIIPDSVLPEYRSAFTDGLKLKSVSDSRSQFVKNGKLISEVTLECTFIPERNENIKIGEIKFNYFNPVKAKYMTSKSEAVPVEIQSSIKKREKISI